ncbi:MAG: hypothetical protein HZB53_13530 [Chloroflexi bacterium]|nr:hypothetical protein [Chloroflexota bacterium]
MNIHDRFEGGALPHWNRFAVGHARVVEGSGPLSLVVGPAPSDALTDAELNDHRLYERGRWPWRPPLRMTVRARASHPAGELSGTAGFGFWNAPFAIDAGAVDSPQAIWFFHASPPSFMSMSPNGHGTGWRAQVLAVPRVPKLALVAAGAAWYLLKPLRPLFYRAAQTQVGGGEAPVPMSLAEWHVYRIDWRREGVAFFVDDQRVFATRAAPRGPLGFCAWIDNSVLDVRGEHFASGYVAIEHRQLLELSEVRIEPLSAVA